MRMRTFALIFTAAWCLCVSGPSRAEIVDLAPNGFTFQTTVHIDATADNVFASLVQPARWWNSEHTFSGKSANLSLNATAGGCFCEKLSQGGSVEHLVVVYVDPGKVLRLRGALGPFQSSGVAGAMTWTLKSSGSGTDLSLTYAIGGYWKDGFSDISKAAEATLIDMIARLKREVETGSPEKR